MGGPAVIPILSPIPHRRAAGRDCQHEDFGSPASGTRNTAAASEITHPVDVSPQERLSDAGSHLIRLHGAGFRLQSQSAAITSLGSGNSGRSSVLAPVRPLILETVGAFTVLRSVFLIGFHRTRTVCQDTASKFANPFHFKPFCRLAGLVAAADGHSNSERKSENVRQGGEKIHV